MSLGREIGLQSQCQHNNRHEVVPTGEESVHQVRVCVSLCVCVMLNVDHLVPRHVHIESSSLSTAHAVKVGLPQVGPEALMLVAVPGEVEHTGKWSQSTIISMVSGLNP